MAGEIVAVGQVSYEHVVVTPAAGGAASRCRGQAGGAAARVAIAARRLGGRVQLFARIGDDAFGNLVALELRRNGVETSQIAVLDGARTPVVTRLCDESGRELARYVCQEEGMDSGWETPEYWRIDRAGAVFVDGQWPAVCLAAVRRAKACSVPSIAEIGFGGQDVHEIISLVDFPVLSGAEAEDLGRSLLEGRAQAVVVRRDGGEVEIWKRDGARERLPAFPATTSAEDSGMFLGAFVHSIARGQDVRRAVEFASASVARPDAEREELDDFMSAPGRPDWSAI